MLKPLPATPSAKPQADPLAALRQPLAERLMRHARASDMITPAALPNLVLMRQDQAEDLVCSMYEPCVVLVVQGSKRVTIGDQTYHYDPQHLFVTPLDVPALASILEASPQRPFLSMALRLDLRLVSSMILEGVASPPPPAGSERRAMSTAAIEAPMMEAFGRLLALLDEPAHAGMLGPLLQREITYRLLSGDSGWRLRQIAAVDSQGHQVTRAIDLLRGRYTEALRIDDLARAAHMSASSLHHHFKALTGMSPLQYQKQLRLAEARRLMLAEHLDAASAAYRVGYESASQFSREYSRHFGAPPMRDMARLRELAEVGGG